MIIDIFYCVFASLALLGAFGSSFLSFYLNKDKIMNNCKYDKWYKFHIIIQSLVWVLLIICALLLIVKKFI